MNEVLEVIGAGSLLTFVTVGFLTSLFWFLNKLDTIGERRRARASEKKETARKLDYAYESIHTLSGRIRDVQWGADDSVVSVRRQMEALKRENSRHEGDVTKWCNTAMTKHADTLALVQDLAAKVAAALPKKRAKKKGKK